MGRVSAVLMGAAVALLSWTCVVATATSTTASASSSVTIASVASPRNETSSSPSLAASGSNSDANANLQQLRMAPVAPEQDKQEKKEQQQQQQGLLEQKLQRLQEQRRLCARCDCFALRSAPGSAAKDGNTTVRVSLDENLDDILDVTTAIPGLGAPTTTAASIKGRTTPPPARPDNQVLVINCTSRLLAEELPRWSWPARLSAGEVVAAETWAEFRGGDLSGVSRLPQLPFRLTRLSLADNRLRTVAPRAFANLKALRDLDLSHNVIADVPHDAFLGLASLERLNLSRNSLSSRPLSADLFKDLGRLNRVSLAHNKITGELNGDTLPWSGSVQELDLSYNGLTSVSAGAWRRLPNIKVLDMSHNKLGSLTPDAFLELRSLERLDLSRNALVALAPGSLAGLAGLHALQLAHNGLRAEGLPAATFAQLSALHTLDLSSNQVSLPEGAAALSALPAALRALDLSHNPLGRAEGGLEGRSEAGAALPAGLETLSLAHCGLQGLDVRAWGKLTALRSLQLAGNDISVLSGLAHLPLEQLNVSSNALTRFPTVALPALRSLDVSHNHLERAPTPLAPLLRAVWLDDNPMEELRVAASPALALLSARRMPQLRSLPRGALHLAASEAPANASAPCLTLLLSHNPALSEVHEDAFRNVTFCQLDLSHNALESLDSRATDWSAVPSLDLQGNPWKCNCRLQWLLEGPMRHIYSSSPTLLEDLRCARPAEVSGRRLVHWFNHTGRALCDGELMDLQSAGSVTFKMSPASLAVVICLGVVAVGLVLLGILAHRRYVARRRVRNRRF
ncbi:Insulin-like growth factor-binding protein complex acid labile subunit [Frankliniella fusca]|uniref:Insulin-like growth factor-binding protein complex acid labile subunit n=1 Tax=Frankliniella fusca TaxID=407009 RepID=A0AAE1LS74_9NEOP|nr:Insulin-like growth factor-binding protein complex acid labile subunit [Frankliniella fusca]